MFQDEARFGRISDRKRCWCRRPLRPMVKKMLSRQYIHAFGAVSLHDFELDHPRVHSITAWTWIIDAVYNAN